jgi:hypothetical protein
MYVTYVGEIDSSLGFLFKSDVDSKIRSFFHTHRCAAKEIEYSRRMHCLSPGTGNIGKERTLLTAEQHDSGFVTVQN